jgi:hypothetical protein
MKKTKHKPCPFCGSTNLNYRSNVQHGHGDCTFEGWIECGCGARNGFVGNWGMGSHEDEHNAWNKWDGKKTPFRLEDYETKQETEEREKFSGIFDKYKDMGMLEFLNSLNS